MHDIREAVEQWLEAGRKIALATVVETWGSAPRGVGAKMAVADDMAMVGSVSGGCVETAVMEEALNSLADSRPRFLTFGVSDDEAWDVGLACGGKIAVYVEPLDTPWWRFVSAAARDDQSVTAVTALSGDRAGQKAVIGADGALLYTSGGLDSAQRAAFAQLARENGQSGRATAGGLDVLVDVQRPRPKLIIIGGAHVAVALKDFARGLGFRVVLVDPRRAFATAARFPDVETILHSYPDKALEQVGVDSESYITILTHDPKIDDPALRVALPAKAPYVGILSSKHTHEKRIARLTAAGLDPALLKHIRIPIGLDIGARTPEEIALCIMAEIVAVRNGALP